MKEYQTSSYEYGISKISGKKIKEIHGYISTEFDEPTFKMTRVEFEDSSVFGCEGEHDFPYLVGYDDKTYSIIEKINSEEEKEND